MSTNVQARTIQPKMTASTWYPEFGRSGVAEDSSRNVAIALAKRAVACASLEELQYLLTNDTRSVVFFDRCLLIIHFRGRSWLSAISNEPTMHQRTQFSNMALALARSLARQAKPILVSKDGQKVMASSKGMSEDAITSSRSFLLSAGSDKLLVIPILAKGIPIGHLVMEFYAQTQCDEHQIQSLLDITPFLGVTLLEKLITEKNPNIHRELGALPTSTKHLFHMKKQAGLVAVLTLLVCAASLVPMPFTVGGEAEVVSDSTQLAFCQVNGTVKEVLVSEGEAVDQGTLLARLDSRELDFQTTSWKNQVKILDHEISRIVVEAAERPSKLAEKKILEVKRQAALNELDFVTWKRQQLDIRAPITGVILTRDIQSLIGKRYRAGDPFVEVVSPEQLHVAIYVPDSRISYVTLGMAADVYLNNSPTTAVRGHVCSVAPMTEQVPHAGNVFRVTASVPSVEGLKIGIKGVGRINVASIPIWKLMKNRLALLWNDMSTRL